MDVFSYGLNRATNSDHYWSAEYLINLLTRSVCNGGNLLLGILFFPLSLFFLGCFVFEEENFDVNRYWTSS